MQYYEVYRNLNFGAPIMEGLKILNEAEGYPIAIKFKVRNRSGGFNSTLSARADGGTYENVGQIRLDAFDRSDNKIWFAKVMQRHAPSYELFGVRDGRDYYYPLDSGEAQMVFRPRKHFAGQPIFKGTMDEFLAQNQWPEWYGRSFVDKDSEYRVYVFQGKIIAVERKLPRDPSALVWGTDETARWRYVEWSEWPAAVMRVAGHVNGVLSTREHRRSWYALDVMVKGDAGYPLEINASPGLPVLDDGRAPYVTRKLFQAMCCQDNWRVDSNYIYADPHNTARFSWRDMIHPALYRRT